MKRIFLFAFLCLTIFYTLAQTNRVGIGTTTPQAQLHATGSIRFDTLKGPGLRPVYANSDGNLVSVSVPTTNATAATIPDYNCAGISSAITITGQGSTIPAANIRVAVNIAHVSAGDLFIYLISPTGQILNLAYSNGRFSSNFINTVFSDAASQSITTGSGPFTNTYRPNGTTATVGSAPGFVNYSPISCSYAGTVSSFAALGGGSIVPNGTWTLKVIDGYQDDIGSLTSWSIYFSPDIAPVAPNYVVKVGGNSVFTASSIYDNGRVGIGTTAPAANLDIIGDTMGIRNVSGWDNLWFNVNGSTASINASSAENGLSFKVGSNSTGGYGNGQTLTTAMTLLPNGRIGIGTITPFSQLSNTANNIVGADGYGGNPGSFAWSANQFGYAAQIMNEGITTASNGLAIKVLTPGAMALDVSQGTIGSLGAPLFNVRADGGVGIGTVTPTAKMEIRGATGRRALWLSSGRGNADNNGILTLQDSSSNTAANGSNEMIEFLNASGALIGSITRIANSNAISFNTTSDTRLKTGIHPTRYGLKNLMAIEVADYQYKGIKNAIPQTGFLAQQLYQVYPEAVTKGNDRDEKQPYLVDYSKLTPLLVKALQELKLQVDELKKENQALKADNSRISDLATQLKALQQVVKALPRLPTDKTGIAR